MRVVVRHDRPIARALEGAREELTVVAAESTDDAVERLPAADALVVNPTLWDDRFLEGLSAGDWVQATSAGYAAFPTEAFDDRGIAFSNAAGNYGPPVADHAFALALGLARGTGRCRDAQRERTWDRGVGDALIDLEGRTLTVVGLGDIGEAIARRGRGFGMELYGTKRRPEAYEGVVADDRVLPPDGLADVLPETDVLALAVPLTGESRGLIDAAALSALPETALVVNVARGAVIDEAALVEALEAGEIAGAGLDVFESEPLPETSPLWDRDDVLLTPHVGGRSEAFVRRFVDLFLENYDRRRADEPVRNRIV